MADKQYRPSEWTTSMNYGAAPVKPRATTYKAPAQAPAFSMPYIPQSTQPINGGSPSFGMGDFGDLPYTAPTAPMYNSGSPTGGFEAFDAQGAMPSLGIMDKLGIQWNAFKEMLPSEKTLFGGVDDKGMRTGGVANTLVGALSGFGNLFNAKQNLDFQKEQFAASKAFGLANMTNSVNAYNQNQKERQIRAKADSGIDFAFTPMQDVKLG